MINIINIMFSVLNELIKLENNKDKRKILYMIEKLLHLYENK